MQDVLIDELEALRRKIRFLTFRNEQLQSAHDFAMASWKQAVKRSGLLSAELHELRGGSKTTVAPYTPLLAKKVTR